jgi:hypothetical protein
MDLERVLPKTPKRTAANVTAGNLERLGAPRLAELLAEQARLNRDLRETLARALAAAAGEEELRHYVERRLRTLATGSPVNDLARARARLRELDALRRDTVELIAPRDAPAAALLLQDMAERAPTILRSIKLKHEEADPWASAVLADLAHLWADAAPASLDAIVDFVASRCLQYGDTPLVLVSIFAAVLGEPGLLRLRDRLQAELGDVPAEPAGGRWGSAGEPGQAIWIHGWHLRRRLREIADVRGDIDGFIALELAQPRNQVQVRPIVERLLKAGRNDEALRWLDDARFHNRLIDTTDLRLATLEALGRRDEAQAIRWQGFEQRLDRAALKDYLKHLPDFEDFEAERRAIAHALGFRSPTDALMFLIAWPDLDSAARLVRERHHAFATVSPDVLLSAGEALRDRHPQEAIRVVRLAALAVLQRVLTHSYEKAAQALADSLSLEPPPPDSDQEPHEAFIDDLRQGHPRHWDFWRSFDARAR